LTALEAATVEDHLDVVVTAERARERVVALGLLARHDEQDSSRSQAARLGAYVRSF